jgi:hypothetical protein
MNVDKGGGVWQHQVLFVDGDTPKNKSHGSGIGHLP